MTMFRLRARRMARDEDGTSTIPFVIFLPFFMMLVISSIEMGMVMVRHVMLERALDMSVRGLRLGFWNPPTPLELKKSVCANAGLIPNCMSTLLIELRPVSKVTWQPLSSGPTCIDKAAPIQPIPTFTSGAGDEMMLVRACAKFYPMAPLTGLGFQMPKDSSGMYSIVSATAYVNEPTPGGS